jgi:hypothetical protein
MRGIVISTADPNLEGRVAVLIPKIAQKYDPSDVRKNERTISVSQDNLRNKEIGEMAAKSVSVVSHIWCRPKFRNNFLVPYEGQSVYVEFEDGDPNKPYYDAQSPTLNGEVTPMTKLKATADRFDPDRKPLVHVMHEFRDGTIVYFNENGDNKRYEIAFKNGHSFSVNENGAENSIELVTESGHKVVLDQLNKHVTFRSAGGHRMHLHDDEQEIEVHTSGGHNFLLSDAESKIETTTSGGHKINMDDAGASIDIASAGGNTAKFDDNSGNITFKSATGGTMSMGGGKVNINPHTS